TPRPGQVSPPLQPPGTKGRIIYRKSTGELVKLAEVDGRPNGIQLSPDEKVLYLAVGDSVLAYDVHPDGALGAPRKFADVRADGLAGDSEGRLYAASNGVRVFSPQGQDLGTIALPIKPANLTFGGAGNKKTLYVVGRGGAYRIAMLSEGPK